MKKYMQTVLIASVAIWGFIGPAWSAGSQNPYGQASVEDLNSGGSFGSQDPFGSGSQDLSPDYPPGSGSGRFGDQQGQLPKSNSNLLYAAAPPVCPLADGKLYQSPEGATFSIQCRTDGHTSPLQSLDATDFESCMDTCSQTDNCHSVQYAARNHPSQVMSQCQLFESGGHRATQSGNTNMYDYAFVVDPPAIESTDATTILCSTECPYADGLQFVTSVGEVFRMDCGKRHGTPVIFQDTQESFQDCIESCGKLLACHSVDYDGPRKLCYYSNHQASPTISALGFGSAYSMGCDGACNNNGCGEKSCASPCRHPSCSPGIERLIYDNLFKGDTRPGYPSFKPEAFKDKTPESIDVVQDISFHDKDGTGPLATKAMMYRMFLYACEAGEYKFVSDKTDDIVLMWFGPKALGDYNRDNADLAQTFRDSRQIVTRTVSARTYYPIRVWFGNQGGPAELQLRIYDPNGVEVTGQPAGKSDFNTKPCQKGVPGFEPVTPKMA